LHTHEDYELLAQSPDTDGFSNVHVVVIFRAKDDKLNEELVKRINSTREMYVSGTKWQGKPACRIAVSTWRVEVERDFKLVSGVLEQVL